MTIEYLGVRGDLAGSDSSLYLMVRGDLQLSDSCRIVIERPGQNRPYLAESGWQSNYTKCLIHVVSSGQGDFDLCLPLSVTEHLDSEYNYKVELFDLTDESVGVFGMNWTPPPRGRSKRVAPVVPPPVYVPPETEPVPEPVVPEPIYEPPKPRVAQRTVMNCVRCGGQIFSTFSACPYCGEPVSQH